MMNRTAIIGASGSFKGIFVQGVLNAFEEKAFFAETYVSASSSTIPIALASMKSIKSLDSLEYWIKMYSEYRSNGFDIAKAILQGIDDLSPQMIEIFNTETELLIGLSEVMTKEAAELTQSDKARQLGKELLIATRNRDSSWAKQHLKQIFASTKAKDQDIPITKSNFKSVLYATTRMMHAWKYPALVDSRPMIDASYTCSCAAIEMLEKGFDQVIAIVPEIGKVSHDFFNSYYLNDHPKADQIVFIQPSVELKTLGLDYLKVKDGAFEKGFEIGYKSGLKFLNQNN